MRDEIELVVSGAKRGYGFGSKTEKTDLKSEIIQDMLQEVEAKDDKIRREGKSCLARPVE